MKSHRDRCDISSVDTIEKIYAEEIALLKEALSKIKNEGIHSLKKWLYEKFIEKKERERFLDSEYPSMKKKAEIQQKIDISKDLKQHKFWPKKEIFEKLLTQLAILENGFIDQESAKNWENIYNNHFTGEVNICGKGNKIIWIKSIASFKYFYEKCFKSGFFEGAKGYTVFFEAHFLHKVKGKIKEKAAKDIRARYECIDSDKKKLDRIFNFLLEEIKKEKN